MASERLLRFDDKAGLIAQAASLLLDALSARQAVNGSASLCLTGGALANQVYDQMASAAQSSHIRTNNIHLWWSWDYFVATDNPERNSLQALSRLAGALSLDPAKIHPIPSSSVTSDPEAGAAQYAQELREHDPIDICLLELNPSGQIAGFFSQHLASTTTSLVAGITDAPLEHRELVTLTRKGLNTSREIWVIASGEDVAEQLPQALGHDPDLPASHLTGSESVLWLTDPQAASRLPFHHCTL
ncbi:MAG: 6-phosphogluconolactonase [Propionibacteriaceae bacterium]|nr:6-phosphogluconolactonase [Propionibacteriaceae bacterium]